MRLTVPLALALLGFLPVIIYLGWPTRGPGRRRDFLSLALRLIITMSVILALAGLELLVTSDQLAVVFVLDLSDSIAGAAQEQAYALIRESVDTMGPEDQAGLVVFGGDALVERPVTRDHYWGRITSLPISQQSDLAEAIRLAQALFPPDSARRMVLLTDGRETTGDALKEAQQVTEAGIDLRLIRLENPPSSEVLLTSVRAPADLIAGEQFDLAFSVEASERVKTRVRVFAAGELLLERELDITSGRNAFSLPLIAGEAGFARYQVLIEPQTDNYYQNNFLAAYSFVSGPPRVLLVAPPAGETVPFLDHPRPDEYTPLQTALSASGYHVEVIPPSGLPSTLMELAAYGAILLVDVPAQDLSLQQMQTVQAYVRDLGGGLLVVGGPTSYGVGGYYRTPLETTLPVGMRIKSESRLAPVTIVFVIDQSGSMSSLSGGVSKIDLAKEAAIRSIQLMFPDDQVGVVAFDEVARWVVPVTSLANQAEAIQSIGSIRSSGGTDILAGLKAVAGTLPEVSSRIKHVILLSDGGADPTGLPELVEEMLSEHEISLSTVAVGRDAAPYLPSLAQIGEGRFHFAADPSSIPSIFTQETTLATRAYLVEEPMLPEIIPGSPILEGLARTPPLYGYVATSTKSAAQTILVSDRQDPILATWQYGLGRAAAFTSDATGRWAQDWIDWEGFTTFWSQVVRFIAKPASTATFDARVETVGDRARILLAANGPEGKPLNDLTIEARVVTPDQESATLLVTQVAPGRYEGFFQPTASGAYLIHLKGEHAERTGETLTDTFGWVLAYPLEYSSAQTASDLLTRLETRGGAQQISPVSDKIFKHDLPAPREVEPVWPGLLLLAALLFPVDIALRRLNLSKGDLNAGWQTFTYRLKLIRGDSVAAYTQPDHIRALFSARNRIRKREITKDPFEIKPVFPRKESPTAEFPPAAGDPAESAAPLGAREAQAEDQPGEASLAATLLSRKRAKEKQ